MATKYDTDERKEKTQEDSPLIDLELTHGGATVTLTLSVGGVWKPQFFFPLLPVASDKTDILEAMLRDALEEIEHLKRTRPEPVHLSVTSGIFCGYGAIYVSGNCAVG
ncbi:hypothetical protein EON65_32860 [archaeon]|nr:MAG: hypothetical protein EON65_32860 [archaeon]